MPARAADSRTGSGWLRSVISGMPSHPIQAHWPQRPSTAILYFAVIKSSSKACVCANRSSYYFILHLYMNFSCFLYPVIKNIFQLILLSLLCWQQWSVRAGLFSRAAATVFRYASRGGCIFCHKVYKINPSWYYADIRAYDRQFVS